MADDERNSLVVHAPGSRAEVGDVNLAIGPLRRLVEDNLPRLAEIEANYTGDRQCRRGDASEAVQSGQTTLSGTRSAASDYPRQAQVLEGPPRWAGARSRSHRGQA